MPSVDHVNSFPLFENSFKRSLAFFLNFFGVKLISLFSSESRQINFKQKI